MNKLLGYTRKKKYLLFISAKRIELPVKQMEQYGGEKSWEAETGQNCLSKWDPLIYDIITYLLGRSNGQRELNSFLLPPPFWTLLFWVLVWIHKTGTRLCVERETKDYFKFLENKYGLNLPFPEGALTHSSAHIDICIVYHPIYVCSCK